MNISNLLEDERFSSVVHLANPNIYVSETDAYRRSGVPYAGEVCELLEKHFGRPSHSLTLEPIRPGGRALYFHTDIDEKGILAFRDALNENLPRSVRASFPEMIRPELKEPSDRLKALRLVRFRIEGKEWYAEFFRVEAVRYHRTYNGLIAADLVPSKHPYVWLSSLLAEGLYGLWEEINLTHSVIDAVPYRINRNLYDNPAFRGFIADFLSMLGTAEEKYILKDVARSVEQCGFFLPRIPLTQLLSAHTPGDITGALLPERNILNQKLNAMDLNLGYVAASLLPHIDPRDVANLARLTPEDLCRLVSPEILFSGIDSPEGRTAFLRRHYEKLLLNGETVYTHDNIEMGEDDIKYLSRDYLDMCAETNTPPRFIWDTNTLVHAHNEVAALQRRQVRAYEATLTLVTEPSGFDALELQLNELCPNEFERIRTMGRLSEEGEKQHNCVVSRRWLLQNDEAAIFHWACGEKNYTVQFRQRLDHRYFVGEIRATCNGPCRLKDRTRLEDLLREINAKLREDEDNEIN